MNLSLFLSTTGSQEKHHQAASEKVVTQDKARWRCLIFARENIAGMKYGTIGYLALKCFQREKKYMASAENWDAKRAKRKSAKKPTTPGVPKRSTIQVLSWPNVA